MNLAELLDGLPDVAVYTLGPRRLTRRIGRQLRTIGQNTRRGRPVDGPGGRSHAAQRRRHHRRTVRYLARRWRLHATEPSRRRRRIDQPARNAASRRSNHHARLGRSILRLRITCHRRRGSVMVDNPSPPAENPRQYDADVALLQFTSGTTGPPKPVPLRHSHGARPDRPAACQAARRQTR